MQAPKQISFNEMQQLEALEGMEYALEVVNESLIKAEEKVREYKFKREKLSLAIQNLRMLIEAERQDLVPPSQYRDIVFEILDSDKAPLWPAAIRDLLLERGIHIDIRGLRALLSREKKLGNLCKLEKGYLRLPF